MRVLGRLGVPFGFVTSMGANGELKNLSPLPIPKVQYSRVQAEIETEEVERGGLIGGVTVA